MGTFQYTATDRTAKIVHGSMEAADERAVVAWLRANGYYPIKVGQPGATTGTRPSTVRLQTAFIRGPSVQDILAFTQQLATLLEAGMELDRSVAILLDLTDNERLRSILRGILTDIQTGSSFADSLAKHPRLFSRLYVNMVKAGEASGVLEVILGRLAGFLERSKAVRDEVTSALIYPVLLLFVGGGAVVVMMNFVIPRFAQIFADTKQLMPLPTRILLAISAFTTGYWWVFIGLIIVGWASLRTYLQTEQGRMRWDEWKLALPLFGSLIREIEVSRFARTFGTLLQSGVPVLNAVSIVKDTLTNRVIAGAMSRLQEGVKRGEGISGPLRATAAFPPFSVHMARVGEETGRLEEMLIKVADTYDERVRRTVKRLTSLLEPVLILSLGLIVGFIVLSMLLAIFSINELPV
ncbi:general secretory pathway protein [Candidatus Methylomirabilis lanthanidiphila]|uniref:General secretory pathway protein n=1 Tax=Candidatus Methylomirabilis lanthanidiphila TaxID=2211376 RepID=A0A564ZLT4_9BACT|nr:type II secretion system F family protein [Candidatus Methylomirabilis lanthanidiphila]VUZ85518.1 general secretory pathway protein [Candidatus Methylomirabilis lanthanidiphila]